MSSTHIVVFTKRVDFKTLLEIECKSLVGFAPIVKDSLEELKLFLGLMPKIDILILDDHPSSNDYSFLAKALFNKEAEIGNILVLSNTPSQLAQAKSFEENALQNLIQHMKGLLKKGTENTESYISIPIDSLVHFKMLPFDLFIKLSEGKFVKRIHTNEDIDENTIVNLKGKGITELHFERKHNRDFSIMLLNNMINKVESDYSSREAQLKATNEVFLTTKQIVQSVGLPPKVIEVCESVMDRITTDVTRNKDKMSNYLQDMKTKSSLSFQFQLVELTSYIATQMIDASSSTNKEEEIRKVLFASFFCDISLKDPSHHEYRSEESLKDMWHEDQKVILEHALKSSEVVEKYKNAPPQTAEIVKQHHGTSTGKGFQVPTGNEVLPQSLCLMSAQEIAFDILKNPQMQAKEVVEKIKAKYASTALAPYIDLFAKTCS